MSTEEASKEASENDDKMKIEVDYEFEGEFWTTLRIFHLID